MSISDLVKLIVPSFGIGTFQFPGMPSIPSLLIDRFQIDIRSRLLSASLPLPPSPPVPIIPGISLTDLKFILSVGGRPLRSTIGVQGNITIGDLAPASFILTRTGKEYQLTGLLLDEYVSLQRIGNIFGVQFGLTDILPPTSPVFDFTIRRPRINATFVSSGKILQMSFSGSVRLKGFPLTTVTVAVIKPTLPASGRTLVAAFDIAAFKLTDLIRSLTGDRIDISGLPGLGTLRLDNIGLTIASKDITLPEGLTLSTDTLNAFRSLVRGAAFSFARLLNGKLHRFQLSLRTEASFDITLASPISLDSVVTGLFPPLRSYHSFSAIAQVIPFVSNLNVIRLAYDGGRGRFTIAAALPQLVLVPGHVVLNNLEVVGTITTQRGKPATFSFALAGSALEFNFLGFNLKATLSYDSASRRYSVGITTAADRVQLSDFFTNISPLGLDSNPVVTALRLGDVAVISPRFQAYSHGQGVAMR